MPIPTTHRQYTYATKRPDEWKNNGHEHDVKEGSTVILDLRAQADDDEKNEGDEEEGRPIVCRSAMLYVHIQLTNDHRVDSVTRLFNSEPLIEPVFSIRVEGLAGGEAKEQKSTAMADLIDKEAMDILTSRARRTFNLNTCNDQDIGIALPGIRWNPHRRRVQYNKKPFIPMILAFHPALWQRISHIRGFHRYVTMAFHLQARVDHDDVSAKWDVRFVVRKDLLKLTSTPPVTEGAGNKDEAKLQKGKKGDSGESAKKRRKEDKKQ
jgi:hypothetical protein